METDFYTEQMDAEGLGRGLLLTPRGPPERVPEKQTVGTVTASHRMLSLQALSSSLNAGTAKRGFLGQGRLLGDLRQSVPQNGRVHLLGVDDWIMKRRTWAIAVRGGSYESLFLLNSGRSFSRKKREIQF